MTTTEVRPAIAAYPEAEALDWLLGDPRDQANPFGFAAAVARDEQDEFPDQFVDAVRVADFHLNYLPAEWGGTFVSFDRSLLLVRTAARRDLNVMPATMFSITAATCLILHGSPEQQRRAAQLLRDGGAIGFALSEREHGSDLLANTTVLVADGEGWRLTGTKWMVGLGERCEAVYLVARTGARGPGAFSAVFVELADLPGFRRGPGLRMSGMRGIDFAGLNFVDSPVPPSAVVGRLGEALEVAVKAQQVVRVMSLAGSLGCADTALRLTLDFAASRKVGRTPLIQVDYPRRELAVAAGALIAADVVALTAARGLHVAPEVFSVWGCAAKHVVAESTEDLMAHCATVLATRSVLRDTSDSVGLFQKLRRDAGVVRVVDTSTVANLRSFASQLPALNAVPTATGRYDEVLRCAFTLDADLPAYDPARLDLNARGKDPVTAGLPEAAESARAALAAQGDGEVADLVDQLARSVARLWGAVAEARNAGGALELVDLAERFSYLHAGSCCLHVWTANQHLSLFGTRAGSATWLGAALGYLLAKADGVDPRTRAQPLDAALDIVTYLHSHDRLFSALPVRLAAAQGSEGSDV